MKSQKIARIRAACSAEYQEFVSGVQDTVKGVILPILIDSYETAGVCGAADFLRDRQTFERRLTHEGIKFATTTLPKFFDSVLQELETGVQHYPGFKLGKDGRPVFLRKLTSLAFSVDGAGQARGLSSLYQIAYAFKKLKGPYQFDVLLKHAEDFVKVDKEIANLSIFSDPLLKEPLLHARRLITKLFSGLTLSEVTTPHPGPGATNTPVEKYMRYQPHVLYENVNDVFDYQEWFYSHPWDVVDSSKHFLSMYKNRKGHSSARFKHVHKTVGKPRGICIEENEMQWFQQGLKDTLVNWIETHPLTRGYVNFTSQGINRTLASQSSETQDYATIDMSDASDRVLKCLVLYLFKETEIFDALAALSTPVITFPVEYDMKDLECSKFAPMGSGLCFPIMAIVHWALIHGIMHNRMTQAIPLYVYGDDIVLPSRCVKAVYNMLPRFGMKINKNKSFYRSHFRESCGLHAYKGVEITPVFFKKIPTSTQPNTPDLLTYIAQERDLFKKGYVKTAEWLRIMSGVSLPFVLNGCGLLGWLRDDPSVCTDISFHAYKKRYNVDHQAWEYKVRLVRTRLSEVPPLSESRGYLRKMVHRVRSDAQIVDGCPEDTIVFWGWTRLTVRCKQDLSIRKRIDDLLRVVEHHTSSEGTSEESAT